MTTHAHPSQTPRPGGGAMPSQAGAPHRLLHRCSCGGNSKGGECEACRKRKLQRSARGTLAPDPAPPLVHDVVDSPGRPLDGTIRADMESRFAHDFSRVRVHDDAAAAASADAVRADAYAVGSHVVFNAGRWAPQSAPGRRLLAHELTHVVQQDGGAQHGPIRIVPADHATEREAETIATDIATGGGR